MEYLLLVGIAQALFTSVFLATKRSGGFSDKFLACWMVAIALPMIAGATVRLWPGVQIPVLRADLVYPLTYDPFLWLYIRALTGDIARLSARELIHFLPFVAISLFQFATGWAPVPPNPEAPQFGTDVRLVGAATSLSMLVYVAATARRLRLHSREVVQHFSNLPGRVTLAWLSWLTAGIAAVFLLLFFAAALSLPELLRVHLPAQVALIMALSFFGLRQTQVFDETTSPPDVSTDRDAGGPPQRQARAATAQPTETKGSYSRSGLTEERAERISRKLEAYTASQRPYLSADLTIEDLARRMAVPRHHLTEVISTRHDKNFFLFVNEYRIEAVKQAMQDPANADATLLDLAYACGFNSKTPFNAAFKKITGVTPSQYRAQLS